MDRNFITEYLMIRWLSRTPDAVADIKGSEQYPAVSGTCKFFQTDIGVFVLANITGLPYGVDPRCGGYVFGMHIHDGLGCIGDSESGFSDIGYHYNPENCLHPNHAGDLVPLFSMRGGYALSAFITDRFRVNEVLGRPLFIHSRADDFTTQPSGNAGIAMACGVLLRNGNG